MLGEKLVDVCQALLQFNIYWKTAANEGDVLWDEAEAADYVDELFTDSAQRYLSQPDLAQSDLTQPGFSGKASDQAMFSLPATQNLVVMFTIAGEGEISELETNLADPEAMQDALKALINLHYQGRLRGIQIHFSPAQFGDELTDDQLLQNFPELVPI